MNWGTRVPCDYQMALEQQNCKYFFSLVKGHMSDQVSILAGQNRNVVGRLSSFTFYLFFGKKNCSEVKAIHTTEKNLNLNLSKSGPDHFFPRVRIHFLKTWHG